MSTYHWKDGWHFRREGDGSVSVLRDSDDGEGRILAANIPASEWASIVHAVAHPHADFYLVQAAINGAPMRVDYTLVPTYYPAKIPLTGPCDNHPPGVKCMACSDVRTYVATPEQQSP